MVHGEEGKPVSYSFQRGLPYRIIITTSRTACARPPAGGDTALRLNIPKRLPAKVFESDKLIVYSSQPIQPAIHSLAGVVLKMAPVTLRSPALATLACRLFLASVPDTFHLQLTSSLPQYWKASSKAAKFTLTKGSHSSRIFIVGYEQYRLLATAAIGSNCQLSSTARQSEARARHCLQQGANHDTQTHRQQARQGNASVKCAAKAAKQVNTQPVTGIERG